ncbi:hypothetical protein SAMN05421810_104418 [Amycolatopsis arida]|uniref:DNA-binding transcriptional regulator of glucitol operon n=1 Tax=Amycolatopsis arida TaxID=587909 RepID=A0A1I5VMI5_9PSEU|nr:hypothetical protein [Amycolatopsis arida]TDX87931.1 hypothetical protein CLV69_11264 [Amycolatopsis arida]SFQ08176.1 hypothetical protein SAMN05421810_104418 [Amycolatopsis arida]
MRDSSVLARRLAIVTVCLTSLVLCCGLAWWQWERFSSAGGTFQNLGYVLQWPLFGLFPIFVFWRMRQLRRRAEQHGAGQHGTGQPASGRAEWGRRPANVPAPRPAPAPATRPAPPAGEQDDTDDELAAYNRYLAELHRRDQRRNS